MNRYAALTRHCLAALRSIKQTDWECAKTLGDDVGLFDRPTELAVKLKARMVGHRATAGINWLALAVLVLEARAHA